MKIKKGDFYFEIELTEKQNSRRKIILIIRSSDRGGLMSCFLAEHLFFQIPPQIIIKQFPA